MLKILFLTILLFGCIVLGESRGLKPLQDSENTLKLANFVCDAVADVMESENGMRRVAIVRYQTSFDRDFTDEIGKCLTSDVAVLSMDLNDGLSNVSMQKPSMVVLLTEKVDLVSEFTVL